ncbi:MAG: toprim domain-containing protein, partial [Clostridia bacterium]
LLKILRDTAIFYYKSFTGVGGAVARAYMGKRGFTAETLTDFGVGYSPDALSLVKYLEGKGYSNNDCVSAGVLQKTNSGRYIDALSSRVIVPIINMTGDIIAFGGRAIDERTMQYGKYKNTSETEIFLKKNNLYAVNLVKKLRRVGEIESLIIVEGYMDVLGLYQAGVRNAVASMGTSLTKEQAMLVSRLSENVYICYDGDSAGQKATIRGLDILKDSGLSVKVVSLPEGLDPDEIIIKYGEAKYQQLLTEALPLTDYKFKILRAYYDINNLDEIKRKEERIKYVNKSFSILSELDSVEKEAYIEVVARDSGYTADFIRSHLTTKKSVEMPSENNVLNGAEEAMFYITSCILSNMPFAKVEDLPQDCKTEFMSSVFRYIRKCHAENKPPQLSMIFSLDGIVEASEQSILAEREFHNDERDELYYNECVARLKKDKINSQIETLKNKYKSSNSATEKTDIALTLQKLAEELVIITHNTNGGN